MSSEHHLPTTAIAYFVKIAELRSLTQAAAALGVSQPSLSAAVRRLEETLETQLLVRTRQGVEPTPSGEVLLRHARQVLRTLDLLRSEIRSLEEDPRGEFVLGLHESLGAYFLPGFMGKFLERYPGIQLTLWNGNSLAVERAVIDRVVDVALIVNPTAQPDCVVQPLFRDRVELIVSASLLRKRAARPLDLVRERPLIYVASLRQVQQILEGLARAGVAPVCHLPCSSMELVKSLVLDGVGVGILPRRVAAYGIAAGRLTPVSPDLPHFDDSVALVRRADLPVTRATRFLLDALAIHGRAMPPLV
jgi:DNA-binding transcriptional LysR family regulator